MCETAGGARRCQAVSGGARRCQAVPGGARRCQAVPGGARRCQAVSGCYVVSFPDFHLIFQQKVVIDQYRSDLSFY